MVLDKKHAGKAETRGLDDVVDKRMVAVAVAGRSAARAGAAEESEFHRSAAPLKRALPRRSDRSNIGAVLNAVEVLGRPVQPANTGSLQAAVLGQVLREDKR